MIGKTNIPMGMQKGETVSILLKTNQSSNEDLNGVKVVVSYNDESHEYTYNGQFSVAIPNGKTYTVQFGELNGYKTPSSVTYTATQGFSRSVEVTYSSEFLTLNVTGTSTPVVTIKKAKEVGISEKYKVVDYVETNGTQYIDTGFKPNQNTKVVVDFHANDVAKHVWGSRIEWRNNSFLCCWENNFYWCVQINAANFNGGSFDAKTRHTVEMSCTEFKVDGTTTATYSVDAFQCTNNLLIASVQNSEQSENFVGKYYSFKVYDGNNLVRDYVPVKDSQGVYGLYDRINDTFSSSTGSLAGGGYIYDETIATQTSVSGLHKIAYDTEYMIEASAVEGFTTPEAQYYTANQPSRNVSVDYLLAEERVTVNVSAEGGVSVDGQMVKVSKSQSIDDDEEYTITNGKASFSVPYDETYTVSLSDMDGYTTPESQTYTASQPTRELSMEYKKAVEHVIVNVVDETNAFVNGQTLTVSGGVTGSYTINNSKVEFDVPEGLTYTVSVNDKTGYITPESQTFTAGTGTRQIDMIYIELKLGVFIQGVSGKLYETNAWTSQETPNGIAVITEDCRFVMALNDAHTTYCEWGSMNTEVSNITTTKSESVAQTDYDGEAQTTTILNTLGNSSSTSDAPAAYYCRAYTFPNGKKGYLGAAGEWDTALDNKKAIDSALQKGGGVSIGDYYWTSTQYNSYISWSVAWDVIYSEYGYLLDEDKDTENFVRAFCSL